MNAFKSLVAGLPVLALLLPGIASVQPADVWKFEASVYFFLADVGGQVTFPPTGASKEATVDIGEILENLKMGFMGSFEALPG